MNPDDKPLVGILMGSDSDWPVMRAAPETLTRFGVASEYRVASAHRSPEMKLAQAVSRVQAVARPNPASALMRLASLGYS